MRVLLTNNTLAQRAGSELYLLDVATALRDRGHTPVAFSTVHGSVADELRAASIPVVDDPVTLAEPPDVIHGQHHLETMTALLHFPDVPAVYFQHGLTLPEETPPRFPRILRYVTLTPFSRQLMALEHNIPLDRIDVIPTFVDARRFQPRGPLPNRPQRALIFSNQACEATQVPAIRQACRRAGIVVDVRGQASGRPIDRPYLVLPRYDLVFAIGRAALEAMAVGTAVILCDAGGVGPMVTSDNFDELRSLNLGLRTLAKPLESAEVLRQIDRYDPADAARVSDLVRSIAGLDGAVDRIVGIYRRIADEYRAMQTRPTPEDESRAAAAYLRSVNLHIKQQQDEMARIYQTKTWRTMSVYWRYRDTVRSAARRIV